VNIAKNGISFKIFIIIAPLLSDVLEYRLYFEFYYIDRQNLNKKW